MAYKSYSEQIQEHLSFLHSKGFEIEELMVNAGFVRRHQTGKQQYRGELAYKTRTIKLNSNLTGVQTWFRGPQGETGSFQTYGMGPIASEEILRTKASTEVKQKTAEEYNTAGRKAYGFWQHSNLSGRSAYLENKKVGYYGIRFRSSEEYGDVAVVPMIDSAGRLWNYQLLNPNGTKRQPRNARTEGLFHMIGTPKNGESIGVAESYVTSASCFELTGIPIACAFSCQNLKSIALTLKHCYPESKLIIFADNDKHLEMRGRPNQGIIKGQEAIHAVGGGGILLRPDFGDSEASTRLSDWNDLINQRGFDYAKAQIEEQLKANGLRTTGREREEKTRAEARKGLPERN
jgi:phage/plasmid primase-like uncharacterized protein